LRSKGQSTRTINYLFKCLIKCIDIINFNSFTKICHVFTFNEFTSSRFFYRDTYDFGVILVFLI